MSKKIEEPKEIEETTEIVETPPIEKKVTLAPKPNDKNSESKPKKVDEPFNGLDLSPVLEKIDEGFKNLEKTMKPENPPTPPRQYKLMDEFDPELEF